MRLIDADALLNSYDVCKVTEYDESGCGMTYKAVSVEAIEKAPAVDAEPVRRGKWKYYSPTMMECSICKRHASRHKFKYCPNCGAKMNAEVR